jgi:hypothetical protein
MKGVYFRYKSSIKYNYCTDPIGEFGTWAHRIGPHASTSARHLAHLPPIPLEYIIILHFSPDHIILRWRTVFKKSTYIKKSAPPQFLNELAKFGKNQ